MAFDLSCLRISVVDSLFEALNAGDGFIVVVFAFLVKGCQDLFLEGVYPRECGGTLVTRTIGATMKGLSPRVRGNPHRHHGSRRQWGSIPASAGEPP